MLLSLLLFLFFLFNFALGVPYNIVKIFSVGMFLLLIGFV